jgi:hypothetical protein
VEARIEWSIENQAENQDQGAAPLT